MHEDKKCEEMNWRTLCMNTNISAEMRSNQNYLIA